MPVLTLGHGNGQTVIVQAVKDGVSTYIHEDAVPWFVAYVADEHAHGGVADQGDDQKESEIAEGNSSVPGLSIQWNFQDDDGWVGTFVSGPLRSVVIKSKLSTLTEAKWNNAWLHGAVKGSLGEATVEAKKSCVVLHRNARTSAIRGNQGK